MGQEDQKSWRSKNNHERIIALGDFPAAGRLLAGTPPDRSRSRAGRTSSAIRLAPLPRSERKRGAPPPHARRRLAKNGGGFQRTAMVSSGGQSRNPVGFARAAAGADACDRTCFSLRGF